MLCFAQWCMGFQLVSLYPRHDGEPREFQSLKGQIIDRGSCRESADLLSPGEAQGDDAEQSCAGGGEREMGPEGFEPSTKWL